MLMNFYYKPIIIFYNNNYYIIMIKYQLIYISIDKLYSFITNIKKNTYRTYTAGRYCYL